MGPLDSDVVLHATGDGFALDIRSHWYRSLPLTSLAVLDLAVDGESVPDNDMTIAVNGREFTVPQLADGYDEWWYVLDPVELRVRRPGFDSARPHQVEFGLTARPKLGTTLFCFTLEMRQPGYSLEGMIDRVAELGLGHDGLKFGSMGWGCRKFPRAEDGLTFSATETDQWGMPKASIQYALSDREQAELEQAIAHLTAAAKALGRFVAGGEPRIMPAGSSLHYQGTYRIGDDGEAQSVCDSHDQVWGLDNLFLGGNGTIPTATACNPTLTSVAIAARSVPRVLEVLG